MGFIINIYRTVSGNAVKVNLKPIITAAYKVNIAVNAITFAKPVYNKAVNFIFLAAKQDIFSCRSINLIRRNNAASYLSDAASFST